MKITSINVLQAGDVQARERNTERAGNVRTILENVSRAPKGTRALYIAADDISKFERYALQKQLQKAGAHVTVTNGTHSKTGKPVLVVNILSEAEWKEYVKS